jgi:hypothetical protein
VHVESTTAPSTPMVSPRGSSWFPHCKPLPSIVPVPVAARDLLIPVLDSWDVINITIQTCTACRCPESCTQKVPSIGNLLTDLLIVGEGQDKTKTFVANPSWDAQDGYSIACCEPSVSVIGVHPPISSAPSPNNRDRRVDESKHCRVYLDADKQIAPKVILSVGRFGT